VHTSAFAFATSIPATRSHVILDSCNSFFVLNARKPGGRRVAVPDEVAESPAFAPEDRLTLKAAMAELPVEQRACVALCVAAGYSHAQAAGALALPVGTVKSHVARGKARLLASLRESL